VLYVGSYLALIDPVKTKHELMTGGDLSAYRFGGEYSVLFYWPLEEVDRKLRPDSWSQSPSRGEWVN
jgi:hypothetical protein